LVAVISIETNAVLENRQSQLANLQDKLSVCKYVLPKRKDRRYNSREMARSYAQYCPVAHALELVGERWSLLVVRELLGGPKRYTDLAAALPGIGTNILAARLRDLEQSGIVAKRRLPPPAAVSVYELTPYGEELSEPLYALGRWGAKSLGPPRPNDSLAPGWLRNAVKATCKDWEGKAKGTYELRAGDEERVLVRFEGGAPVVDDESPETADVVIETDPATLFCIASKELRVKEAIDAGAVRVEGKRTEAERFLSLFSFDEASHQLEHV
jgi:DNA-binding HxlR family transcriptional regulator/putative sterol carrier protein